MLQISVAGPSLFHLLFFLTANLRPCLWPRWQLCPFLRKVTTWQFILQCSPLLAGLFRIPIHLIILTGLALLVLASLLVSLTVHQVTKLTVNEVTQDLPMRLHLHLKRHRPSANDLLQILKRTLKRQIPTIWPSLN